jgi:hydrogenase maturation factor HypE
MKFGIEITPEGQRKLNALKTMNRPLVRRMTGYGAAVVKAAIRNVSGTILGQYRSGRKSGELRRNISQRTTDMGGSIQTVIGTGIPPTKEVVYARIHEEGGIIKAKKKYLTIPFPGIHLRARDYPNTAVITSKAGNKIMIQNIAGQGFKPLFLLKPEVNIPARYWLSRTMDECSVDLKQALNPQEIIKEMIAEGE